MDVTGAAGRARAGSADLDELSVQPSNEHSRVRSRRISSRCLMALEARPSKVLQAANHNCTRDLSLGLRPRVAHAFPRLDTLEGQCDG
jgi:hypothetical protein